MRTAMLMMLVAGQAVSGVCDNQADRAAQIRFIDYAPNKTYRLQASVNQSTVVAFDAGERILWLDCGNCVAPGQVQATASDEEIIPRWRAKKSENEERLFIRPQAPGIRTNISLETDRGRFYTFRVQSSQYTTLDNTHNVWRAHFCYPEQERARREKLAQIDAEHRRKAEERARAKAQRARDLALHANRHYGYDRRHVLAPLRVYDDGEFTRFEFAKNAHTVGIYTVDVNGYDVATDEHVEGNTIVVHGVAPQYTLRRSGEALCVFNRQLRPVKMANNRGGNDGFAFSAAD